jgi:hypothetical protein
VAVFKVKNEMFDLEGSEDAAESKIQFMDFLSDFQKPAIFHKLDPKNLTLSAGQLLQELGKIHLTKTSKGAESKDKDSPSKLDMIEFELDEIATDVRSNINALFTRGEQFEKLDTKAEALKENSVSLRYKAKQARM